MAPIPFWVATTIAPEATALAGLTATIVVPQPTWADVSLSYTVTQTDSTGTVPAVLSGGPVVDGDNATLTVTGLTVGDSVSFTVTVTDGDITVTSLSTSEITATA